MPSRSSKTSSRAGAAADERNSRADWVRAGLALLLKSGIEAVRVEPLALRLGVTKGSFYWHFKDRAALHAAMLEEWSATATGDVIAGVDRAADARARLRQLIARTTADPKVARLETAIRSWANSDDKASRAVAAVDSRRLDFVAGLLQETGVDPAVAQLRAQIIYLVLIGSFFTAAITRVLPEPALWIEVEKFLVRA
jgi:AcrR family transcriptional regulator